MKIERFLRGHPSPRPAEIRTYTRLPVSPGEPESVVLIAPGGYGYRRGDEITSKLNLGDLEVTTQATVIRVMEPATLAERERMAVAFHDVIPFPVDGFKNH